MEDIIMTRKVYLLAAILLVSVFSAQASLRFGVRGGVNLAKASLSKTALDSKNFTGFNAGVIGEFMFPGALGFGLEAGALYSQEGMKVESFKSLKDNRLEVPVNLKYRLSLVDIAGLYFTAGPYASFKLSSNLKDQFKSETFGVGLNFGAGVSLFDHLDVGVNYKLGLSESYKSLDLADTFKGKPRVWSVNATYFF